MPNANTPAEKKWYVHDEYDCFNDYERIDSASTLAARLVAQGMNGVHIVHMTQVQHDEYCMNGDLRAAIQLSGS